MLQAGLLKGGDVVHGLTPVLVQSCLELVDRLGCYHCVWQGVPVVDDLY